MRLEPSRKRFFSGGRIARGTAPQSQNVLAEKFLQARDSYFVTEFVKPTAGAAKF